MINILFIHIENQFLKSIFHFIDRNFIFINQFKFIGKPNRQTALLLFSSATLKDTSAPLEDKAEV